MKVRELIKILRRFDQDLEVFLPMTDDGWLEEPDPVILDVADQPGDENTQPAPRVVFSQLVPNSRKAVVLRDPEF